MQALLRRRSSISRSPRQILEEEVEMNKEENIEDAVVKQLLEVWGGRKRRGTEEREVG